MPTEVDNVSSRRLADTALAVGIAVLFYPLTIAPTGVGSNGGVLGFSSLVAASFFAWRALALNEGSPWLRRLLQVPLAAGVTYLAIREAFVRCIVGWSWRL
jgi:hypothetical protein